MNKQEVISKLKSAIPKNNIDNYQKGETAGLNFALLLLAELDEQEKPVVPQFVADWYEEHKDNFEYSVHCLCVQGCAPARQIDVWFDNDDNKPIVTLVKMKLYGYDVEKEKLYTVEIPNPNGSEYRKIYLAKNKDGEVELFTWSGYTSIDFADNWKQEENAQLTETEIKKDHGWAWQFAKEVEE